MSVNINLSLDPEEEKKLIESVKDGDPTSFEPLVATYQDQLYHLILRQVGNKDDALDIAQETFLKAFHKIELFRMDSRFGTWLMRIAINECRGFHRKRLTRPQNISLEDNDSTEDSTENTPITDLENSEKKEQIHHAINQLDPTYSQVLILFHLQGHSHKDVAKILKIPLGTVKTRLYRGHRLLVAKLKDFIETPGQLSSSKEAI